MKRRSNLAGRSNEIYETVVRHIVAHYDQGSNPEVVLAWIEMIASFCWLNPTGRYVDGRLENIALDIGRKLVTDTSPSKVHKTSARRTILHVATTAYDAGGHTRVFTNWIKNDESSDHSLVLLNQGSQPVPEGLPAIVGKRGGELTIFPSETSRLVKARRLRELARNFDAIVLHHHPNDLVPLVALADEQLPPVAIFNHADHVFWIGVSIADTVIEFREEGAELSKDKRNANHCMILPLPLERSFRELNKQEARAKLQIPNDQVMLLSIGAQYKYEPNETHNFFATISKVLDENPTAEAYVIGPPSDWELSSIKDHLHERQHLLGVIGDPSLYFAAADIYLCGFPYGSGLALLEAIRAGACPMLAFAPASRFMVFNDVALANILQTPMTEQEYITQLSQLITNRSLREELASSLKARVLDYHLGATWSEHLSAIYGVLDQMQHGPREIPATEIDSQDEPVLPPSHSDHSDVPVLFALGHEHCRNFGVTQLGRLFWLSLKLRDTTLRRADLRHWWQWLKEILYPVKQRLRRAFQFESPA